MGEEARSMDREAVGEIVEVSLIGEELAILRSFGVKQRMHRLSRT